mgnify:CR=1 FL=1
MEGGRRGKEPAAGGVVSPRASSVIGAVASLGTNLVLYPLDLIKVKLQGISYIDIICFASWPKIKCCSARAYREMLEASRFRALRTVVASTFRDGGLRAFYVGLTPGTAHDTPAHTRTRTRTRTHKQTRHTHHRTRTRNKLTMVCSWPQD